jgi:signal recognition particle receptor subunit beta
MGQIFSNFWRNRISGRKKTILLLGIDCAGKTTILFALNSGKPTSLYAVNFSYETLSYKNFDIISWDTIKKNFWPFNDDLFWNGDYFFIPGIIFVIDSNDRERFDEAKCRLHEVLRQKKVKGSALLVMANKSDFQGSSSNQEIAEALELHSISDRKWTIKKMCVHEIKGFSEGIEWLERNMI